MCVCVIAGSLYGKWLRQLASAPQSMQQFSVKRNHNTTRKIYTKNKKRKVEEKIKQFRTAYFANTFRALNDVLEGAQEHELVKAPAKRN